MAAIEKTTVLTFQDEQPDIVQRFLTTSELCMFPTFSGEARVRVSISNPNALRGEGRSYLHLPQYDQHGVATNGGSI